MKVVKVVTVSRAHITCRYAYKVVSTDPALCKPLVIYRGEDCVYHFLKNITAEEKWVRAQIPAEQVGKYRLPVMFHNLKGYDSHLICQDIGRLKMPTTVIPNGIEKYQAIFEGRHASSLERLAWNLQPEDFIHTTDSLMRCKGIYPYEYMDCWERFEETELPPKENFYSKLKGEGISDDDYKQAQKVWGERAIKTLGDYHDFYLTRDVLLLADVFEAFRKICMQYYKLDPAYYFSTPAFSWDAMLKMTGINLELISDVNMYQFFEKGTRGGVSFISHRHGMRLPTIST